MDGNDLVARFIASTKWDTLPETVQRKVRMALLDILGATLAGTLTPVSRITADYAVEIWPGDEATVIRDGRWASAIGAAFANGYTANGIDIDDCAMYTRGHPGAQVFPTALAVAEKLGLGGREMLTAMVIGYEVASRAARCWHDHHQIYQACGSWGSVACAAVASNLLNLTPKQIEHALGIAEYHAPNLPMMRDIDHPTMVKHGVGWGAMTGISAAGLAARGFTGILSILGFEKYRDWVTDVGQRYIMVEGLIWKEYACCAWAHAALDAASKLVQRNDIQVEDIAHIRVEGYHETVRLGTQTPTTTEEAQFNLAWPLAALLVDGKLGPEQMLEHRFGDSRILGLVSRIELLESEDSNRLYRLVAQGSSQGKYASAVTVTLKSGRRFNSGMAEGSIKYPQPGWDEQRVEEKFRWLARYVLDETSTDELVDMVWHFEEIPAVRELTQIAAQR